MRAPEQIINEIDRLAGRLNGIKCGTDSCTYRSDMETSRKAGKPWVREVKASWCGSCVCLWHLCEASVAAVRQDFGTGDQR